MSLFNVYAHAAAAIQPVCPLIKVKFKISLQQHRTHTDPILPQHHDRYVTAMATVQGQAAGTGYEPAHGVAMNSGRHFNIYISSLNIEILSYLQQTPFHVMAYFTYAGRDVTSQVLSMQDRRHNGWVRLEAVECKTATPPALK